MISKLRIAVLSLLMYSTLMFSTASADEIVTYLIYTRADTGELLQGAAFTDSDQWQVNGYIVLEQNERVSFTGSWNRLGTIEAVDSNGEMYMLEVVTVLKREQALYLTGVFLI